MSEKTNQSWGGRFDEPVDAFVARFTASVDFDRRLYRHDIAGSIAHATMLARVGVLTEAERDAIVGGLRQILAEIEAGTFEWRIDLEDVHMNIEARLTERIGIAGKKLHTGRSRNDQVATDVRLWLRDEIDAILAEIRRLQRGLIDLAEREADTVMPGFTHLQTAQPVTFGHHLLAWFENLDRDHARFADARRRVNRLPLGAAALAGTTYPIDREYVRELLGFDDICRNSLDAVSDRDFAIETCAAGAILLTHLSRFSEELVLWTSAQFNFVSLPDRFCTGSSIMPQKKNPDVAELARGKTGRVFGHLMAMLTVMKGLPLTHNTDMQEDKEGLFDAVDTMLAILTILPPALASLTFITDRMARAATADFSLATDAADLLARNGVPFREAHHVVGALVGRLTAEGRQFHDLSETEWAEVHPVFAKQRPPLTAAESVAARDIPGGTAPNRVRAALGSAQDRFSDLRAWQAREDERMANVMRRNSTGPD